MSLETFERLPAEKRELVLSAGIGEFSRKSYADAGTDAVIKRCGISKGLLFHYFGSKKAFYLYCLDLSLRRLTEETGAPAGNSFYEIIFSEMDRKMDLCRRHGDETLMVNMASRDMSGEIAAEKEALLRRYTADVRGRSSRTLGRALETLDLKDGMKERAAEGLQLYLAAVINRYLLAYRQAPERFFENGAAIREEMKTYLDLILYGICR